MSTAREELYQLADENSDGDKASTQNLTKDDVVSAIHEYSTEQSRKQQEQEQERRQTALSQKKQEEHEELQEVVDVVKTSLKEEMDKDKDFAKIVRNSDLPGNLVEYIAEGGEPEEAHLIIRELAGNEEYQESLKRCKTEMGTKRLIGKIRKDVLTGGTHAKIPPMLKKSIPNYNANISPSDADKDYYSDLAMRHGI